MVVFVGEPHLQALLRVMEGRLDQGEVPLHLFTVAGALIFRQGLGAAG